MDAERGGFTITSREAASILGVSVAVLRNYNLPYRQYTPNGRRWYRQSDIDRFIETHTYNLEEAS